MNEKLNSLDFGQVPLGTILASCLSEANIKNYPGWLQCDGSLIDKKLPLSKFMKETPNLSGRTLVGAGKSENGNNYNYLTSGGEEMHKLTVEELPSHDHGTIIYEKERHQTGTSTKCWTGERNTTTTKTGKDKPHNNMPPYFVVNYIIYAGVANN